MRSTAPLLSACLLAMLSMTGTPAHGGAQLASEQRALAGIQRVVLRAAGDLVVRQGDHESLRIEAEPRLLPVIASEVRDGTLYLEFRAAQVNTAYPVRFDLTVKRLEALSSQASGDIHVGVLKSDAFTLELAGSGSVDITALQARHSATRITGSGKVVIDGGRVATQTVEIEGAGDYAAGGFASRDAKVRIAGSGNVAVAASERLGVEISGSGDVAYRGDPTVAKNISGAGNVHRID